MVALLIFIDLLSTLHVWHGDLIAFIGLYISRLTRKHIDRKILCQTSAKSWIISNRQHSKTAISYRTRYVSSSLDSRQTNKMFLGLFRKVLFLIVMQVYSITSHYSFIWFCCALSRCSYIVASCGFIWLFTHILRVAWLAMGNGRTSYRKISWSLEAERFGFIVFNRSEIWQAPWQQRCRDACQISKRYDYWDM